MIGSTAKYYIKPRSLTWWASIAPALAGVFIVFEPVHGLSDWVAAVSALFGNTPPLVLINAGLAGIGLRAAIK